MSLKTSLEEAHKTSREKTNKNLLSVTVAYHLIYYQLKFQIKTFIVL